MTWKATSSTTVPRWHRLLTRLAARLCDTPTAVVGLTLSGWRVAALDGGELSTEAIVRLCNHVMGEGDFTSVNDLTAEGDSADAELRIGGAALRSMAGTPIRDDEGQIIGALCVLDSKERTFGTAEETALAELASLAGTLAGSPSAESKPPSRNGRSTTHPSFLLKLVQELQQPVSEIAGFSEVLQREVVGESRRRAQIIRANGNRVVETLRAVLDLVQLDSRAVPLSPEPLDLAGQAREAVEAYRPKIRERGLSLKFDDPDETVEATVDRVALRRILYALLSNAVRFTDKGGITVSSRSRGSESVIEIRDTGVGISEPYLAHLFEDFSREHARDPENPGGSGLGLAIAQRLVELSGGRIDVASRLGVGSVFELVFPATGTETAEPTEAATHVDRHDVSGKPVVLLVEDNAVTRRVISMILRKEYEVVAVAEVNEAFARAREHDVDILLLDISLNDRRTGVEVLHGIRKMPRYANVPAVACTAYSLPGLRDRYFEAGFDGYVAKPFRNEQLLAVLRDVREPGRRLAGRTQVGESVDIKLPPLPTTLPRIMSLVGEGSDESGDLADILDSDPIVSAWVLRTVNSAAYSLHDSVTSVDRAVTLLGSQPVCDLVVAGIFSQAFAHIDRDPARRIYHRILETTLAAAGFARHLAALLDLENPEVAFAAGMIHDAGRLGILSQNPDQYAGLWIEDGEIAPPTSGKELLTFGIDHTRMGAEIAAAWALPEEISAVVRHYHDPRQCPPQHRSLALTVALGRHAAVQLIEFPEDNLRSDDAGTELRDILRAIEVLHGTTAREIVAEIGNRRDEVRSLANAAHV